MSRLASPPDAIAPNRDRHRSVFFADSTSDPERDCALSEQRGPMSDFELPNTRYALSGDVNIAFQVMGDGPIDIILVPSGIGLSHVEFLYEFAGHIPRFLRRLATFARVVTFGTSEARGCRTDYRESLLLSSVSTKSATSWTTSESYEPCSWDFPRALHC